VSRSVKRAVAVRWFRRSASAAVTLRGRRGVTQGLSSGTSRAGEACQEPQEGRRLRFATGDNADGFAIETLKRPLTRRLWPERLEAITGGEAHGRRQRGSARPSRDRGEPWRGIRSLLALSDPQGSDEQAANERIPRSVAGASGSKGSEPTPAGRRRSKPSRG